MSITFMLQQPRKKSSGPKGEVSVQTGHDLHLEEERVTSSFLTRAYNDLEGDILGFKEKLKQDHKEVHRDVVDKGCRVDSLERAVDEKAADTETLTACLLVLEEQHIILQGKCKDLENHLRHIIDYVRGLFIAIHEDTDSQPPDIVRVHRVAPQRQGSTIVPDVVMRVHFYRDKEQVMKKASGKVHYTTMETRSKSIKIYQWLP
ncbi:hypothetical protein NDU88_006471 [Pleurodeles waltl]|uniref:Uncharacterized protein n=1 Tax=Pleurodeles waltl TaxID=8319 RepID=A0AAV7PRF9_PLEWA|nr:hypothetical protein NDU88_006471 [Pleurodeles waltl]